MERYHPTPPRADALTARGVRLGATVSAALLDHFRSTERDDTMTSLIWPLASQHELAPIRPDRPVAVAIAAWWRYPLKFACNHIGIDGVWFVAHPDPRVRCAACGLARIRQPGECVYCHEATDPHTDDLFLFEIRAATMALTAHPACHADKDQP